MKTFILVAMCLALGVPSAAAADANKSAAVSLSPDPSALSVKLGEDGGQVAVDVCNNGDQPVAVTVTKKSCGCMEIMVPEGPVAAHARGTVRVVFGPGLPAGVRQETVLLNATEISRDQKSIDLPMQITVTVPALAEATPMALKWDAGKGGPKVVTIKTIVDGASITGYHLVGDGLELVKDQTSMLPGKIIATINRIAKAPTSGGVLVVDITLRGKVSKFSVQLLPLDEQQSEEEKP